MAINLTFSKEDILSTKLIDRKQWLPFRCDKIEQKPSKAGDSMNVVATFICAGGEYEGLKITKYFSEKFQGGIIPFLTGAFGIEIKPGDTVDIERATGKTFMGLAGPTKGEDGKERNDVFEYRQADQVPA